MSTYLAFQLKKVFKNILTPISLLLVVGALAVVLVMNKRTESDFRLEQMAKTSIEYSEKEIVKAKKTLLTFPKDSKKVEQAKFSLAENKRSEKQDRKIIKAVKAENWKKAYEILWQKSKRFIAADEQNMVGAEKEMALYGYLKNNPLKYETQEMPVTGWQIWMQVNEMYLPYLFAIVALFLLSLLLTDSYRQKLATAKLLPLSNWQRATSENFAGFLLIAGSFSVANLLLFIFASVFSGTGNLAFPTIIQQFVKGKTVIKCVPTGDLILPIIILQIMYIFFIVALTRLLACIFRDKMPTLLVALLVVLGINLATMVADPLKRISAWLPMTYLNAVDVVNGKLGVQYQNGQINFQTGLVVLIIGIILMLVLATIISSFQEKITSVLFITSINS